MNNARFGAVTFGGPTTPAVPVAPSAAIAYLGSQYFAMPYWGQPYFSTTPVGMAPAVVGTDLATVLLAARQRLVDKGLYTASTCELSLVDEAFPTTGDRFALIAPLDQRVDQGQAAGGGRYLTAVRGEFEVRVYRRVQLDLAQRDTATLTHATRGILRDAHKIIDALQMFFPLSPDGSGNILVEEPIRLSTEGKPIRYKTKEDFVRVHLPFECNYLLNLDVSTDV